VRSGLAEVVKTALIGDAALLDRCERDADALARCDLDALVPAVRASIAEKARVVAEDERETSGARFALNFGHTIGHALEANGAFSKWTHGEAVALGMVAALRVGVARGVTSRAILDRTVALLARLGLPHVLDPAEVTAAMPYVSKDKKRSGSHVSYVLVPSVGAYETQKISVEELASTLRA
jgi:3-dehydroquinate synthetase